MSWPKLLKRIFDMDVQTCEICGGAFNIIKSLITWTSKTRCCRHTTDRQCAACRGGRRLDIYRGNLRVLCCPVRRDPARLETTEVLRGDIVSAD